jgi:type VI secretion system protein ImpA
MPDDEGAGSRVVCLGQLSGGDRPGTLIGPIERIRVTGGAGYSRLDFEQASELETVDASKREARMKQGWVTMEAYRQAVAATPSEAFARWLADATACERELARLCNALECRCQQADGRSGSPPSSRLREALERCRLTLEHNAELRGGRTPPGRPGASTDAVNGLDPTAAPGAERPPTGTSAGVRCRDDVVRALRDVAGYLRAAEPHTPVTYLVEKAVRWVQTPLPELLTELIDDTSAREMVFRLTGVPRRPDGDATT